MNISSIAGSIASAAGLPIGGLTTPASNSSTGKASFDDVFKTFKEEAAKTPEERAKDAVLKKHGLSSDQYDRLPSDQKKAIDQEIKDAVRQVEERRKEQVQQAAFGGATKAGFSRYA